MDSAGVKRKVDAMSQRIGNETAAERSRSRKLWDWLRRYRVWGANRKVFVYPENYLEPEQRDDKSTDDTGSPIRRRKPD